MSNQLSLFSIPIGTRVKILNGFNEGFTGTISDYWPNHTLQGESCPYEIRVNAEYRDKDIVYKSKAIDWLNECDFREVNNE